MSKLLRVEVWIFLLGIGMMIYFGWQWGEQVWMSADSAASPGLERVEVQKSEMVSRFPLTSPEPETSASELYPEKIRIGERIGTLIIPEIDAKLPIIHGADEDELAKGVGHYQNSVLPGERDRSVMGGHRETSFRKLGKVKEGALLIAKTQAGTFTYQVKEVQIVNKDDRTVIRSTSKPELVLVTCFPFDMFGAAPERYVLIAELQEEELANFQ